MKIDVLLDIGRMMAKIRIAIKDSLKAKSE